MNRPYVKIYNDIGLVANPIQGSYMSTQPNRRQRREAKHKFRLYGGRRNNRQTTKARLIQFIENGFKPGGNHPRMKNVKTNK